ncbi:hypothetical protein AY601_2420 [Pedobacter cryoconitis]|uniref:Uncharacterized protein n=1 Tax=Pedobacter cryoconitis TaxID=188932 RepID=A0A127VDL9_9SPHI|nr:hypothetical protein [Pedobacter cryoconitis]AMP99311.1 hypothetical protein AY601_2420 [Pedobacter cryoconitis]
MRIIFYFIFSVLILFSFLSCSKGEPVKDLLFGKLAFIDFTPGGIRIIAGSANKFSAPIEDASFVSGENRFRFYDKDILLIDTLLRVEAYKKHTYFMFKPNADKTLRIFDETLNGFDKETLPDTGSVKISMANYFSALPNKVDIAITTNTYQPPILQLIQVAEFLNVTQSFSQFKVIIPGKDQLLQEVNSFTLIIKDVVSKNVLKTIPFTLPKKINSKELASDVYLLYVNDQGGVTTLMSK